MRRFSSIGLPLVFLLLAGAAVLTAPLAAAQSVQAPVGPHVSLAPQAPPVDEPARSVLQATQPDGGSGQAPGATGPFQPAVQPITATGLLSNPVVLGVLAAVGVVGFAVAALFIGGARIVDPEEVLRNETRRGIFDLLKREVGANLKDITEALGLTTTNAIWHLRKLEEANLVCSRRFNGYKIFYPAEGGVAARRLSVSMTALANDNARAVFEFIVANPGSHQRQIARALEVNHGTVRWHLKKLGKAELVTEVRQGKTTTYFSTEIGRTALSAVDADEPVGLDVLIAPAA